MTKFSEQKKPSVADREILLHQDSAVRDLARVVDKQLGRAVVVQDQSGGSVAVRFNREAGRMEFFQGKMWVAVSSASEIVRTSASPSGSSRGTQSFASDSLKSHDHSPGSDGLPIPTDGIGDEAVTVAKIGSGSAVQHQVLAADGQGGASFEQIDHAALSNIGVNSHSQIDTALTRLADTSGSNTGDQTLAGLGGVPNTRRINGHALSGDVSLTSLDVGADASGAAAGVQGNLNSHAGGIGTGVHGLGTASTLAVDTDGAMGANSDARVPSQKAVKSYVASTVPVALSNTAPPPPYGLAVTGTSTYAMRADASHLDYPTILYSTLEQLMWGTLNTGNPTPAIVTRTFGNASTDNNGIAAWTGSWSLLAGFVSSVGGSVSIVFRTSGTNNIVLHRGAAGYDTVAVILDGVTQSAWAQAANESYTLSSVAGGVHTIALSVTAGKTINLSSLVYYTLPYQGVGVTGDTVKLLYVPREFWVTSIGIGPTNNGATYQTQAYGEGIIHRLPNGTACADSAFARDSIVFMGPSDAGSTGLKITPMISDYAAASPPRGNMRPGLTLTAGLPTTRGLLYTPDVPATMFGWSTAASAYKLNSIAAIGQVTLIGSGSHLSVGNLILVLLNYAGPIANQQTIAGATTVLGTAMDVFKLPSSF